MMLACVTHHLILSSKNYLIKPTHAAVEAVEHKTY